MLILICTVGTSKISPLLILLGDGIRSSRSQSICSFLSLQSHNNHPTTHEKDIEIQTRSTSYNTLARPSRTLQDKLQSTWSQVSCNAIKPTMNRNRRNFWWSFCPPCYKEKGFAYTSNRSFAVNWGSCLSRVLRLPPFKSIVRREVTSPPSRSLPVFRMVDRIAFSMLP